jgi:hypothetical protein
MAAVACEVVRAAPRVCVTACRPRRRYEDQLREKQHRIERLQQKLASRQNTAKQLHRIYKQKDRRLHEESGLHSPVTGPDVVTVAGVSVDTLGASAAPASSGADGVVGGGGGSSASFSPRSSLLSKLSTILEVDGESVGVAASRVASEASATEEPSAPRSAAVAVAGPAAGITLRTGGVTASLPPTTRLWLWGAVPHVNLLPPSASLGLNTTPTSLASVSRLAQLARMNSIPDAGSAASVGSAGGSAVEASVIPQPQLLPLLRHAQLRAVSVCEDRMLLLTRSGDVYTWRAAVTSPSTTSSSGTDAKKVRVSLTCMSPF